MITVALPRLRGNAIVAAAMKEHPVYRSRRLSVREVRCPFEPKIFSRPHRLCRRVVIRGPLTNEEFRSVAAFLRKCPRLGLAIVNFDGSYRNLDFLAAAPFTSNLAEPFPMNQRLKGDLRRHRALTLG